MSQKLQVLNHIKRYGSITPIQAFSKYQITCLAERIRDLKDSGHQIAAEYITRKGKRFARYKLVV